MRNIISYLRTRVFDENLITMRHQLPNTDHLRNQALKSILSAARQSVQPDDYISLQNLDKAAGYLQLTDKILAHHALNIKLRTEHEQEYNKLFEKARIYVLHYLQSINMAVEREELPTTVRSYYGLNEQTGKLPEISRPEILLEESRRLFENDNRRISEGGKYFTNPAIGIVKVWVEKFSEAHQKQMNMNFVKTGEIENLGLIRKEIDAFIDTVWSDVAENARDLPEADRNIVLGVFGVQYAVSEEDTMRFVSKEIQPEPVKEPAATPKSSGAQFAFVFPD